MKKQNNKLSKAQIIKIVVFVCQIIGTFVIPIILEKMDSMTIDQGIAILVANISVLFLTSEFSNTMNFNEFDDKTDEQFEELKNRITIIEESLKMDDLYKQIYMLDNKEQKEIYLNSMRLHLNTMNNRISGSRSGALSRHDYYVELTKAGDSIIQDKTTLNDKFTGEIWAITFWQDDELDLSDAYENAWVRKMEHIDSIGIKTRRLCVMKNKKAILKRENVDESVQEFLTRLNYYCQSNAVCKNTSVFAIDSIDTLTVEQQEWIGKGFFATKLSNGELRLIRGVSLDNRNATTLGGEIDFDETRVKEIRNLWEHLIEESGSQSINDYLWHVSSIAVKNAMTRMGFEGGGDKGEERTEETD